MMKQIALILFFIVFTTSCEHNGLFSSSEVKPCDQVFFAFDSSKLTDESKQTLLRQAAWLEKYDELDIEVLGYCDSKGSTHYNYLLGKRRSRAVAKFLMDNGVDRSRIKIISKGAIKNPNHTYNAKSAAYDRRVDTMLVAR